jgi:hypothetical protein
MHRDVEIEGFRAFPSEMGWLGNPGQLRPRNLDPELLPLHTNDLSSVDRGL